MIRIFIALALTLLFNTTVMAQETTKNSSTPLGKVEREILRLENQTFAAIMRKDAAALANILADDFIYRTPAGPDVTKPEFLKSITSFPVKIVSLKGERLMVKVYGETAVLTGVQRAVTLNNEGKEETSDAAFTDIFVKRGGRWLMVLAYGIDLPPAQGGEAQP